MEWIISGITLGLAVLAVYLVWRSMSVRVHAAQSQALAAEALTQTERERAVRAEALLEAERNAFHQQIASTQNTEQQLRDSFAKLSNEALQNSTEQLLTLAQERFERQHLAVHTDITRIVEPLRQTLDQQRDHVSALERQREQAYGSLSTIIQDVKAGQSTLHQETQRLVSALGKPNVRGVWGEMQLRKVAEHAGMLAHCDFDTQVTLKGQDANHRPDMIVNLPNQRYLIIDAKAPLDAFLRAFDLEGEQRSEALRSHARHIRGHIDAMHKRNYPQHLPGTYDFTIIFMPGDMFYYAALEHDSELLEYSFSKNIILATPATMLALLKTTALGWRETRLASEAQAIRDEGEKIYRSLRSLAEHLAKVGTSIDKAAQSYNEAIGSLENRVLAPSRKMAELGIKSDKDMPEIKTVDTTSRQISRKELLPAQEELVSHS